MNAIDCEFFLKFAERLERCSAARGAKQTLMALFHAGAIDTTQLQTALAIIEKEFPEVSAL